MAEAGGWLAAYTRGERVSDDFGGGFWIRKRTEEARAMVKGETRHRIEALVRLMTEERARIANRPLTRARSHGDLRPRLLVRGKDVLWGLGTIGAHWIAVAKDVARFLVAAELIAPADGPFGIGGFAEADLAGFTGDDGPLHPGEAEVMLPYFAASELAGRIAEGLDRDEEARAAELAARMLGT